MSLKQTYQRAKRSLHEGTGLVGAAKFNFDEAYDTQAHQAREASSYWRQRAPELELEKKDRQAARRLPETIERYGGRVALVTNFGSAPGMSGPRQVGFNIARALIENGFDELDELTVNSMFSMRKISRTNEFQRSRVFLRDAFQDLMPHLGHISSNEHYHANDWSLPAGHLGRSLEFTADFRDERAPQSRLGYVCVISALELNSFGQNIQFGILGTTGEDYEKIKYGGALMFDADTSQWKQVVPGNQFDRLPNALRLQSYREPEEFSI